MSIVQRVAMAGCLCLIIGASWGTAWGADRRILGVQISPDLKQITIKCDAPVGKHSSFVIRQPYRLVVDLEATALGSVPGRIAVGQDPIKEIRLGHANSRARVAIDFGDRVVPPFKIERVHDSLMINLAPGSYSPRREVAPLPREARVAPVAPKLPAVERSDQKDDSSEFAVKHAGVANNMVYVELTSRSNPKQPYRLVIEMDPKAMEPKLATMSDASGNLRKFEVAAAKEPVPEAISEPARTAVGPRKAPSGPEDQESTKKKFKWGAQPAAQSALTPDRPAADGFPFRLEEFRLEKRKTVATGD